MDLLWKTRTRQVLPSGQLITVLADRGLKLICEATGSVWRIFSGSGVTVSRRHEKQVSPEQVDYSVLEEMWRAPFPLPPPQDQLRAT